MQVGMTMPVMEPDLDASVLRRWATMIDEGPFSSLCWGERVAFGNPEAVTLLGAVRRGRALLRTGGQPGDLLLVSGTLGDAALGIRPGAPASLRARQRRPVPRLELGWAAAGIASAAIDLSDGLLQDLGHLCEASGTGAHVDAGCLPLSAAYRAQTQGRRDPLAEALSGGEDYELLLSVAPSRLARLRAAARRVGTPLTVVGVLVPPPGIRLLRDGRLLRPRRTGHDHLRSARILGRRGGRA